MSSPFLAEGHSRLRLARVKTKISSTPKLLIYCAVLTLHVRLTNMAVRRTTQHGGPRVGHPCLKGILCIP